MARRGACGTECPLLVATPYCTFTRRGHGPWAVHVTAGPRRGPPGPMGGGHPRHRRGSSRPGTERAYCESYGCCEGRGVAGMVCGAGAGVPLHQETRRFWAYWCGPSRSTAARSPTTLSALSVGFMGWLAASYVWRATGVDAPFSAIGSWPGKAWGSGGGTVRSSRDLPPLGASLSDRGRMAVRRRIQYRGRWELLYVKLPPWQALFEPMSRRTGRVQ